MKNGRMQLVRQTASTGGRECFFSFGRYFPFLSGGAPCPSGDVTLTSSMNHCGWLSSWLCFEKSGNMLFLEIPLKHSAATLFLK